MTVVGDLLRDAQGLLGKGRSQDYEATTSDDEPIDATHQDAAKFSVWGALQRAAFDRRDSTGLDTALVYLGADNIQDPQLKGFSRLEDDKLNERFEEAIRLAEGGERKERSPDHERKTRKEKREERAEQSKTDTASQQEAEKRSGEDLEPKPEQ